MAQYFYQIDDAEWGPVSFDELTELICSGEVGSETPVRLVDSSDWTVAEEIPGLLRAAKKRHSVSGSLASDRATTSSGKPADVVSVRRKKSLPVGSKSKVESASPSSDEMADVKPSRSLSPSIFATIAVICLTTIAAGWWMLQPHRFPQPRNPGLVRGMELSLEDMKAPASNPPSIDIAVGVATPIPGLEAELGVSSPSLNADLTTIVYLKVAGRQDDIFLAQRSSRDVAFQKPVRLKCSTSTNEQFCSLSPDGTQLLFTVQGQPSKLCIASSADTFATSKPLQFAGIDVAKDNADNAQWLSNTTIRFAVGDPEYTRRTQRVAEIHSADGTCRVTSEIPMQNAWPRMHFSANLERAYFANASGISITAPKVQLDEFGMGLILFDPAIIGPIDDANDDPLFVVPKEDVIFFTGPGPAAPGNTSLANRIWMIRI